MRRAFTLCVVLLALLVGACGDDDTADPSGTTTSTEPGGLTGSDSDGESGDGRGDDTTDDATDDAAAACEAAARDALPAQAARSFPDNSHNTWAVADSFTDAAGLAVVEAVPSPDDVGYPSFRFVSRCDGDEVVLLGAYALDGGWVLLFTTDAPGASDLAAEG